MKDAPLLEDDIVVGNRFDKHGSGNPVVRRLMEGFDRGMFEMLAGIPKPKSILEVGCGNQCRHRPAASPSVPGRDRLPSRRRLRWMEKDWCAMRR